MFRFLIFIFLLYSRDYTAKAYSVIQSKLTKKAIEMGKSWTAENVGKCIWIISIYSANNVNLNLSDSVSKITKRKREPSEDIVENEIKIIKEKRRK